MNNIKIENPYLFFILIPLVAIVVVGFFLIPKYKRFRRKNILSLCLHLVMSLRLTLAFVNIQYVDTSSDTELIVLADCSESEKLNADQRDKLIQDVYSQASKVGGTKIGVVAFAKGQQVVTPIGSKYKSNTIQNRFDDGKNGDFDPSATDLKSALLYADGLYSKDTAVRRRIIRSDGLETDGSAIEALDKLTSDSVQIDAISRSQPEFDEVAITGLDYTDHAFVGKTQEVKVSIKSKKSGHLNVTLSQGGEVVQEVKDQPISRGLNVVSFSLKSETAGSFHYDVSVSGRDDTYSENNKMSFTQDFTDHYSVLFVGSTQEELDNLKSSGIYADAEKVKITSYIADASIPTSIQDLIKYDEIVLSNFNIDDVDEPEAFVQSLQTFVEDYGKSLVTLGAVFAGEGTGGYKSDYNALLPIQNESDEGKAIVLLIDNSGSRETDSRLKKAKDGASAILDKLTDKDYISIITFSDSAQVVQPLVSVKQKDAIRKRIKTIKTQGGTERGVGLKASHDQLRNSSIVNKFVITLSDGDPFDSESSLIKIVNQMVKDDIICSFINISNSSGTALLKRLANKGQGTYYYCRTASSLVNVRLTSVVTEVTEKTVEDTTDIKIQVAGDPSLKGVDSLPEIYGYNFARIKKAATTVLTARYSHETEGEDGNTTSSTAIVPIYAYWQVGKAKGTVSSFTSDFGSAWTDTLRSDERGKLFRKQRFEQALPNRSVSSLLDRSYVNHGVTSTVSFIASEKDNNGSIHIKVTSPDGKSVKEYDLAYDGDTFSAEIETGEVGQYTIQATYSYDKKDGDKTERVTLDPESRQLNFDYSSEYDRFPDTASTLLYSLTKDTGQVTYDKVDYQVSSSELAYKHYSSLNVFFRIIAVLLLLVDIFIRKTEFKKKKKAVKPDFNLMSGK